MNMKRLFLLILLMPLATVALMAQKTRPEALSAIVPVEMNPLSDNELFVVEVNDMSPESRNKLNAMAGAFRNNDRGIWSDMANSMLSGGVSAVVNVVGEEILKLAQIRSVQKKKWQAMRNRECVFVDSLESVKGQRDFYGSSSAYGPLDPTDMRFDGITFTSSRNGQEVLKMVCRLDTARLGDMFMHSKFYLVLDSLAFYPYRSYLPNLSANQIRVAPGRPGKKGLSQEDMEYFETISMFSYDELETPTISIKMDMTSSWINEQVQVYQDVRLGSFSLDVPIPQNRLNDTVFIYSRAETIARGDAPININGDCFVVPRSYMPGPADNPSWGTGEYKMKIVMTQKSRIKNDGARSRNWHKDYRRLVRLQNGGRAKNDYWQEIRTTFIDKSGTIIKATYMPLLNMGAKSLTGAVSSGKSSSGGGAPARGSESAPPASK